MNQDHEWSIAAVIPVVQFQAVRTQLMLLHDGYWSHR
jgi:hypothetical protein